MQCRAALFCVLVFHSPDGSELLVQGEAIRAVRQVEPHHRKDLVLGTNAVIYLGIRPNGFAIRETADQVQALIRDCDR